ncbi:MAG TPA: acylphosphatase [Candidatus Binataceae bacterium]|nr:acylphosphatase [Candidatus Binataceae bacterium]
MTHDSDLERVRIVISGRVQGVFFRRMATEQAQRHDLTGWVRNLEDGSVEIVAEGHRRDLDLLLRWAHRGPAHARVDRVEEEWGSYRGEFVRFEIR